MVFRDSPTCPVRTAVFWLIACCLASGDPALDTSWKQKLGPRNPGAHAAPLVGTLNFDISWNGRLDSGTFSFEYGARGAHKPGIIVVKTEVKSIGMGAALYPYRGHGWSELDSVTLRPRIFEAKEVTQAEEIETRNRYGATGVESVESTRRKEKKKPKVETQVFPEGPLHDLGSTLLMLRSQKLDPGQEINLLIHPYATPYLVKAKVAGREAIGGRDCIKLELLLSKIDRKTLALKPYTKVKGPVELWISDDKERLPLEIRAKVFIGDIRATLRQAP